MSAVPVVHDFRIVEAGSADELEKRVNENLAEGFVLAGSMQMTFDGSRDRLCLWYAQAMAKPGPAPAENAGYSYR